MSKYPVLFRALTRWGSFQRSPRPPYLIRLGTTLTCPGCQNHHAPPLILGFPSCIHSDRGAPFVSRETRSFLTERRIAFSNSTPYHPQGNAQCEQVNQTIWRTVKLLLHGKGLPEDDWESVLHEAWHATRSLVSRKCSSEAVCDKQRRPIM